MLTPDKRVSMEPLDPAIAPLEQETSVPVERLNGPEIDALHQTVAGISNAHPIIEGEDKYHVRYASFVDLISGASIIIRRELHHPLEKTASSPPPMHRLARIIAFLKRTPETPTTEQVNNVALEFDYAVVLPPDPSRQSQTTVRLLAPREGQRPQMTAFHTYWDKVDDRTTPTRVGLIDNELEQTLAVVQGLIANGAVRTKEDHEALELMKPQSHISHEDAEAIYAGIDTLIHLAGSNAQEMQELKTPLNVYVLGVNPKLPYAIKKITLAPAAQQGWAHPCGIAANIYFEKRNICLSIFAAYENNQPEYVSAKFLPESPADAPSTEILLDPYNRKIAIDAMLSQVVPDNLSLKLDIRGTS